MALKIEVRSFLDRLGGQDHQTKILIAFMISSQISSDPDTAIEQAYWVYSKLSSLEGLERIFAKNKIHQEKE